VEPGGVVAVVGPSGSGKTTLLGLLAGLDRPTSGTVHLDGADLTTLDGDALARLRGGKVGFVFQSFQLIPQLTVLENVEVPLYYGRTRRASRKERAVELLASVGLSHRLNHLPPQLSGGESQRVAIARALANEPAMILADEPTGNLDTKSGEEVMQLLFELHRSGRTIVMVTHNPEIADRLPRVVEVRDGAILRDTGLVGA
jgi:putative ABC transport system ATP-binding protein